MFVSTVRNSGIIFSNTKYREPLSLPAQVYLSRSSCFPLAVSDHTIQGGLKSKPLPNYHKIMLNRIKVCQWDYILRQIKEMIKRHNIIRRY